MGKIHPTAIIEPGAELGEGVTVGPYAYVGGEVTLSEHCFLHHHACVEGRTVLGEACEVFPFAVIGGKTHDLKYAGGETRLTCGARNVFREYVTVHTATGDGEATTLGNDCHILAYSHVAHDCQIGDHLIMSSHAALGGHVILGDHVNLGWGVGIHQFVRIGSHAMVGACSKAVQDIPPFFLADGNPAEVRYVNKVGLERTGFSGDEIAMLRTAYRILYRDGLNRPEAIKRLRQMPYAEDIRLRELIAFVESTERGLA